jgi:branched-chain amino acid transport system permease protein
MTDVQAGGQSDRQSGQTDGTGSTVADPVPRPERAVRVRRAQHSSRWNGAAMAVAVVVLATLPYTASTSVTSPLINLFVLVTIATMWNLLAGYSGLVSVGQQAYIGLGAYAVVQFSDWGVQPFIGIAFAAAFCAAAAIPTSWLAFRLRGDYFAVGTWVIAEVYRLVVVRDKHLGGGSGRSLTTLSSIDPTVRTALVYWAGLVVAVGALLATYLLLRSRLGLALTAVRDNEIAARSVGVRVSRAKRLVYLAAAAGTGAAGGVLVVSSLSVHPDAIFSVQYSAEMIFIVIIGGIGTIEGPIVGAVIFFALQQWLSSQGVWYLILLGCVAIVCAVWVPRGIWGAVADRFGWRLFPVGFWLAVDRRTAAPEAGG